MDWNGLKSFMAIAETGSLSAAADRLSVNHSTMFRRLKAFEKDIGGRLFERINQRYRLTPLGEGLLEHCQTIAETVDRIDREIVGKDVQPKGPVSITAPYNIACRYLPEALADFRHTYPDIQIRLLSSNQEINMNTRQADIAVRATPSPPGHLVGRMLCEFSWGVYGSPRYQHQFGFPESVTELGQHQLIGGTGRMASLPAFVWLDQHHHDQIHTRCDELTAMAYLAESGHGLALLPDDQARPGIERLLPLPAIPASKLWLLTHPDLRDVERIRLVMSHLTEAFSHPDLTQGDVIMSKMAHRAYTDIR